MAKIPIGAWVMSQKIADKKQLRDGAAFLERIKNREEYPSYAGLPVIGLGGSCGKPCFALPYVLTWNENNLEQLEKVAQEFMCYVEYGAYPHLKLEDNTEVAAIQDWKTFAMIYLRPGYEYGEELLTRLASSLAPQL